MGEIKEKFENIENEFFELDHENKKALMRLEFEKPSDIFDKNAITKIPVLSDDFIEWVKSAFGYAPSKYKIDLVISFNDLESYSEEELRNIFFKNIILEGKKALEDNVSKNKIALGLIGLGTLFLIGMILLKGFWTDGGVFEEIVSYILDIACTVTIWEALTILIVENKEKRDLAKNLIKKFDSISFIKKQ